MNIDYDLTLIPGLEECQRKQAALLPDFPEVQPYERIPAAKNRWQRYGWTPEPRKTLLQRLLQKAAMLSVMALFGGVLGLLFVTQLWG